MVSSLLRPIRQLAQSLIINDTPRQIVWGFTLGMFIGLLPKDNLLAMALIVLLFAVRVNIPSGMLAAGMFSWVGLLLDDFAHRIGSIVLAWEPARPLYIWLYESPLGTWLGTNNTVVVGQLLIAIYLAYPTVWFAHQFTFRIQPRISAWLLRYRVIRWLRDVEIGEHWGTDA